MVTLHDEVLNMRTDVRTLQHELLVTSCATTSPSSSYSPPTSRATSPHNHPP